MKPGGPFGFEALCGAQRPPDFPLLTTTTETSVNCDDCKRIMRGEQQNEEQVPPERESDEEFEARIEREYQKNSAIIESCEALKAEYEEVENGLERWLS
jgi:hypothetical protein